MGLPGFFKERSKERKIKFVSKWQGLFQSGQWPFPQISETGCAALYREEKCSCRSTSIQFFHLAICPNTIAHKFQDASSPTRTTRFRHTLPFLQGVSLSLRCKKAQDACRKSPNKLFLQVVLVWVCRFGGASLPLRSSQCELHWGMSCQLRGMLDS